MWKLKVEIRMPKVLRQCSWMPQDKMEAVFFFLSSSFFFYKYPLKCLKGRAHNYFPSALSSTRNHVSWSRGEVKCRKQEVRCWIPSASARRRKRPFSPWLERRYALSSRSSNMKYVISVYVFRPSGSFLWFFACPVQLTATICFQIITKEVEANDWKKKCEVSRQEVTEMRLEKTLLTTSLSFLNNQGFVLSSRPTSLSEG